MEYADFKYAYKLLESFDAQLKKSAQKLQNQKSILMQQEKNDEEAKGNFNKFLKTCRFEGAAEKVRKFIDGEQKRFPMSFKIGLLEDDADYDIIYEQYDKYNGWDKAFTSVEDRYNYNISTKVLSSFVSAVLLKQKRELDRQYRETPKIKILKRHKLLKKYNFLTKQEQNIEEAISELSKQHEVADKKFEKILEPSRKKLALIIESFKQLTPKQRKNLKIYFILKNDMKQANKAFVGEARAYEKMMGSYENITLKNHFESSVGNHLRAITTEQLQSLKDYFVSNNIGTKEILNEEKIVSKSGVDFSKIRHALCALVSGETPTAQNVASEIRRSTEIKQETEEKEDNNNQKNDDLKNKFTSR